jgi:hypothetical protein
MSTNALSIHETCRKAGGVEPDHPEGMIAELKQVNKAFQTK